MAAPYRAHAQEFNGSNSVDRTFYFCSESCANTFESPDVELRNLKRRMYVAISGVMVLAVLRAAAYLAVAFGAVLVT